MTEPNHELAKFRLLEALIEQEIVAGQIYSISTETIEAFLNKQPDLVAKLESLDPEVLASAIYDAIGQIGILEMVEKVIRDTIEAADSGQEQA